MTWENPPVRLNFKVMCIEKLNCGGLGLRSDITVLATGLCEDVQLCWVLEPVSVGAPLRVPCYTVILAVVTLRAYLAGPGYTWAAGKGKGYEGLLVGL